MDVNFSELWSDRQEFASASPSTEVPGWKFSAIEPEVFIMPPLRKNEVLSSKTTSPDVIMISAPGAVGKSTLARKVAAFSKAIYIDLAKAEPVGANSITGGLARLRLYESWLSGDIALLIDGLDEARLKVTQSSFEAFLADVSQLGRLAPGRIVLLGRTGAVQDAWVTLEDQSVSKKVIEIGFFDDERAFEFCEALAKNILRGDNPHLSVYLDVIRALLSSLRKSTATEGSDFSGYAPVLQAVTDAVCSETNPTKLSSDVSGATQEEILRSIVDRVLARERSKLSGLGFEESSSAFLYLREEQLGHLCHRLYGTPAPALPPLPPNELEIYQQALETWIPEHPFLKTDKHASSAVFKAAIAAYGMREKSSVEIIVAKEICSPTVNPFVHVFYKPEAEISGAMPLEAVGLYFDSLLASLPLDSRAKLSIEGEEEIETDEDLIAPVEISIFNDKSSRVTSQSFSTSQAGLLILGRNVRGVHASIPNAEVKAGCGGELKIVGQFLIECDCLKLAADSLVVESEAGEKAEVVLSASKVSVDNIVRTPTVRHEANLAVSWPGSSSHPWVAHTYTPTEIADSRLYEAARRLSKFIIAFRSHSKGSLARYRNKLDHARMTKGTGQLVLNALKQEGVITTKGDFYHLDANALGAKVGASYQDCTRKSFSQHTIDWLIRAISA